MSSKRFLYLFLVLAILFSGAVMPLFQPLVAFGAAPNTPTNSLPVNGATGVILTPTLVSSAFNDSDNDTHLATDWQITVNPGNYTSVVFQSLGDTSNLENITIPLVSKLNYATTYYWRVRYEDSTLAWSAYSLPETSFTTVAPPLAAFTADKTAVVVGQPVTFTDNSTGGVAPLTYQWDFNNDNVTDSTVRNPPYIYGSAGTYTVVLKVTDNATNTATKTWASYITVTTGLLADFSADNVSVALGQSIKFTNLSGGGVGQMTYQWDFNNDGTWDSHGSEPLVHVQQRRHVYGGTEGHR